MRGYARIEHNVGRQEATERLSRRFRPLDQAELQSVLERSPLFNVDSATLTDALQGTFFAYRPIEHGFVRLCYGDYNIEVHVEGLQETWRQAARVARLTDQQLEKVASALNRFRNRVKVVDCRLEDDHGRETGVVWEPNKLPNLIQSFRGSLAPAFAVAIVSYFWQSLKLPGASVPQPTGEPLWLTPTIAVVGAALAVLFQFMLEGVNLLRGKLFGGPVGGWTWPLHDK